MRILKESVESIKTVQKEVLASRKDVVKSREKVKLAKESAKQVKKQLDLDLKHYEKLEMNARRIIAIAKARELQDKAAEHVSLEMMKKAEAREQDTNYKKAKAVTHQSSLAGRLAAEASKAAGAERKERGHEIDLVILDENAANDADDADRIVKEMEHASEIALSGKGFGGLDVKHEDEIKKEVAKARWKSAGRFASITKIINEKKQLLHFFKLLSKSHKIDLSHAHNLHEITEAVNATIKYVNDYEEKNNKLRDKVKNLEFKIITESHTKDLMLEKCRGDSNTKIKAQVMDYKHKNRSTRSKIEHLKHEKQDYILLFERISEVAQNLLVTYSKTKKDGEMFISNINETCKSNKNVEHINKMLLLSCGIDSDSTNNDNNMTDEEITTMTPKISFNAIQTFFYLSQLYNSI